jgi:hypothetical protein
VAGWRTQERDPHAPGDGRQAQVGPKYAPQRSHLGPSFLTMRSRAAGARPGFWTACTQPRRARRRTRRPTPRRCRRAIVARRTPFDVPDEIPIGIRVEFAASNTRTTRAGTAHRPRKDARDHGVAMRIGSSGRTPRRRAEPGAEIRTRTRRGAGHLGSPNAYGRRTTRGRGCAHPPSVPVRNASTRWDGRTRTIVTASPASRQALGVRGMFGVHWTCSYLTADAMSNIRSASR